MSAKSKLTWEQFLKHKDSKEVLKKAWKAKNPQKEFESRIRQLSKKYSHEKRTGPKKSNTRKPKRR